jgi:DNA-nicking Smr family endonuclease
MGNCTLNTDPSDPIHIPIDGTLDLHLFRPKEVPALLDDYFDECLAAGIRSVRVIHGKGTGTLKRRVHGLLDKHPLVESYRSAAENAGGWGATLVELIPPADPE